MNDNETNYLRWPDVQKRVQLSRVTIWRMEKVGTFPKRRQLSANSVGWIESEVIEWIADRPHVGASPVE